jgi:hypothetical protein
MCCRSWRGKMKSKKGIKYILWVKNTEIKRALTDLVEQADPVSYGTGKEIILSLGKNVKLLPFRRGKVPKEALEQVKDPSFERRVVHDRRKAGHFAQRTVRSLGIVDVFDIAPDKTIFLMQAKTTGHLSTKEKKELLRVAGNTKVIDLEKARTFVTGLVQSNSESNKYLRRVLGELEAESRYAIVPVLVSRRGSHGKLKWTMLRTGIGQHGRMPARENW